MSARVKEKTARIVIETVILDDDTEGVSVTLDTYGKPGNVAQICAGLGQAAWEATKHIGIKRGEYAMWHFLRGYGLVQEPEREVLRAPLERSPN